jgi:hypothetical protein
MKAQLVFILLSVTLLAAVAGDSPHKQTLDKENIAILGAASKYRPEGATTVEVRRVSGMDSAYVLYSIRRDGHDFAAVVVTLKKISKKRWEVESCAR